MRRFIYLAALVQLPEGFYESIKHGYEIEKLYSYLQQ